MTPDALRILAQERERRRARNARIQDERFRAAANYWRNPAGADPLVELILDARRQLEAHDARKKELLALRAERIYEAHAYGLNANQIAELTGYGQRLVLKDVADHRATLPAPEPEEF